MEEGEMDYNDEDAFMLEGLDMAGFADCDIDLSDEDLLDELAIQLEEEHNGKGKGKGSTSCQANRLMLSFKIGIKNSNLDILS
jgi:hypothetical protein